MLSHMTSVSRSLIYYIPSTAFSSLQFNNSLKNRHASADFASFLFGNCFRYASQYNVMHCVMIQSVIACDNNSMVQFQRRMKQLVMHLINLLKM